MTSAEKVAALRQLMLEHQLSAFIVTNADPHLSEYMPDHYKYRAWLSGFTGSAGTVLITDTMAGLWTDGRYYLQAERQLAGSGISLFRAAEPGTPTIVEYMAEHLENGARLGFDGMAVDSSLFIQLKKQLKKKQIQFVPDLPLVATLWQQDRPELPGHILSALDMQFTGCDTAGKLAAVRTQMDKLGLDVYFCGCLEACAWFTNLRSSGIITFNTTFPAYLIIEETKAVFFVEAFRLASELKDSIKQQGVEVREYGEVVDYVRALQPNLEVGLAPRWTNALIYNSLPASVVKSEIDDIITALKAVKNTAEIEAITEGHLQDGAAFVQFLRWFEAQPAGSLTEWDVSGKLTELRANRPGEICDAFNGIVAYGANAAMMHYAPSAANPVTIENHGFLLMDSGGQYPGCTTDITRTISCGSLTDEEKAQFTWVLKSVIGLSRAVFLEGTSGLALDILSRGKMWEHGLDYKCGTGHGVGAGLSVHEGPQSFSTPVKLVKNMVLTIEPGIYLDNVRGIRTENQVYVAEACTIEGAGRFFRFQEFTMAPIDISAIDIALLDDVELDWLNQYHERVAEALCSYLSEEENTWLAEKTAALHR